MQLQKSQKKRAAEQANVEEGSSIEDSLDISCTSENKK